jgi:AraC-like DNA-binding protein
MASLMEEGPDPDLLAREAGFGVTRAFHYQHKDPAGLNAGLRHLLLLSWRRQSGRPGAARAVPLHPAVREALRVLGDDTDEAGLAQIARRCGVSSSYLSRMFARQVDVPLSKYRRAVRLRRFWNIYQAEPRVSVTHAAYAAGFGSYSQFHKVFINTYGKGPRKCLNRK